MPHRSVRVAAIAVTALLALAPSAASAKSAPTKSTPTKSTPTKTPEPEQGSCSQAYKGDTSKPFDTGAIADTEGCFKNFDEQTKQMAMTAHGFAAGCANAQQTRASQGSSLLGLAKAGNAAVATTKKAKAHYFKAEKAYYNKHSDSAFETKLDNAVDAIAKVAFDIDGFYSGVAGIGSAISNDDCDEALTKSAAASKQAATASADFATLKTVLAELKPQPKKKK